MTAEQLRFGSWPSSIRADQLAAGALRLGQPRLTGGQLYWLEGRPKEGGRQVLMVGSADGSASGKECEGAPANVRTLVHEYGGGDYAVAGGRVFCVAFEDQTIPSRPQALATRILYRRRMVVGCSLSKSVPGRVLSR